MKTSFQVHKYIVNSVDQNCHPIDRLIWKETISFKELVLMFIHKSLFSCDFGQLEHMYLCIEVFLKQLEIRYGQLDIVVFENVIYINHVCDNKQCDIGTIATKNEFGSYYKVNENLLDNAIKDWGQEKSYDEQWRNISVIIKDFRDKKLRLFKHPEPEPEQPERYRRIVK